MRPYKPEEAGDNGWSDDLGWCRKDENPRYYEDESTGETSEERTQSEARDDYYHSGPTELEDRCRGG